MAVDGCAAVSKSDVIAGLCYLAEVCSGRIAVEVSEVVKSTRGMEVESVTVTKRLFEPTGALQEVMVKQVYDWPDVSAVSRDWVFDLVALRIRAGTTGMPNRLEEQENWLKLLQVAQLLVMNILSLRAQGQDVAALAALLRETLARFDDRLEVADFIPENRVMQAMQMPGQR